MGPRCLINYRCANIDTCLRPMMLAMNDFAIARAIHVLAIVVWIGGVAMVTTVILPIVRRARTPTEGQVLFDAVERRFIWQARIATLLVAASGFYMVERLNLWNRFRNVEFWWMHAMVLLWLIFTFILFIGEPLAARAQRKRFASSIKRSALLHAMASLGAAAVERNHRAGCGRR
jgi:uncharacterized membrane protein